MRESPCRSCGAPVVWVTIFASGRKMPLDPGYVDRGTRFTVDLVGNAHVVTDPNLTGMPSHFATCPDAAKHRRPK